MPSLFHRDKSARSRGYEAQQGGRGSLQGTQGKERRTWVTGLAISTHIVAGDIVNEILERLLVTRLLALVERTVHDLQSGGRPTDAIATNAWSQSQLRGGGGGGEDAGEEMCSGVGCRQRGEGIAERRRI